LPKIISDYGGSIDKLLLTNMLLKPEGQIIKTGFWENFLKEMKKTGRCPEIYVINMYRDDYEKEQLIDETDKLNKLVKISGCVYVEKSSPPTATQDICTILDSNSFILAGPNIDPGYAWRVSASPTYFSEKSNFGSIITDFLCKIGFKLMKPEEKLRKALFSKGCRYRKHYGEHKIDIAFPSRKIAIFVDGCFWHMCPKHGKLPKSNREYWIPKLRRNVERDKKINAHLKKMGWKVIRVWECEILKSPCFVADRISKKLWKL